MSKVNLELDLHTLGHLIHETNPTIMETFRKYWDRYEAWDANDVMWTIDIDSEEIVFYYTSVDGDPESIRISFDWFTDYEGMCKTQHSPYEDEED